MAGIRRFSVAEYHQLIQLGILTEDDNVELLDGYLVHKTPRTPPHDATLQRFLRRLLRLVPPGWDVRCQSAVTLAKSEPEPDFAVVRGDETTYATRHPGPADIGLVIEVSDSTLPGDRDDKGPIYAAAAIPTYWIVNLPDRQVEVYTSPAGGTYGQRDILVPGQVVSLVLDGMAVDQIAVDELLP